MDALAHDSVARDEFAADVRAIYLRSDDDTRFAAQLGGALRRFHVDRLRATDAGRLYRRVDGLLKDHDELVMIDTGAGRPLLHTARRQEVEGHSRPRRRRGQTARRSSTPCGLTSDPRAPQIGRNGREQEMCLSYGSLGPG